jgi:predicted house-cleaning noncanonical NTP pyrophosphatase (MazG superfamily)
MPPENLEQILIRRKEIEEELLEMLEESGSDFDLGDIKEIIYNEESQDDLTEIVAMFDNGQNLDEMNTILETINDAWNYFPHKLLGGLSPAEKILEYQRKQK